MIGAFLTNIISFPGLKIGELNLNPEAFRIPLFWTDGKSHPVMWYGIIITLAMIVGFTVANRKAKFEGIESDHIFDLAIFLIIFTILGARLYYVLMKPESFNSIGEVFAIWNGGLAIYGGVIAGAATVFIFSKVKKIKTAKLMDIAAPGLIIGQAIGRWGNFFNAEAYGDVTTLPWRMCSPQIASEMLYKGQITSAEYAEMLEGALGVHPTFLYESLWNTVGFILIMCFFKNKKYDGAPTLWYLTWYGFGRFFIEGLRTDSLYLLEGVLGQTVRVSQLVAALCFVGGVVTMIVCDVRARRKKLDEGEYEAVYGENEEKEPEDTEANE